MEESSDSENPATGKMSGSQVNTDWDSGSSEYASAEEELGEGTEDGGRAVSPTQSAPASHAASPTSAGVSQPSDRGNTEGESDSQPADRRNRERQSDSQPPDRGNTEGEPDSQVQETEEEPSAPLRLQQFNQAGATGNHQIYRLDQLNIFQGNDQLQSIAARTTANLERACPQGYVKTSGFYTALDAMKKSGCCIITGTSGSGKTTLARHLLLALRDKGFLPLEVITPDECQCVPWQKVGDENLRLVLLVDNVVGAGNFEDKLRRKWEVQLKPMKPFIERGHILVILASRANIYAAIREVKESGQVLYEAPEVSLASRDCKLSAEEKKEILCKTLAFYKVKRPQKETIQFIIEESESVKKIGFPQLCVYLATNQTAISDPKAFFHNPVQFLKKEFRKLKLDDRLSYFVLILVLLQEGTLSEEFLKKKGNKEYFLEVADLVDLSEVPGLGKIKKMANQLCESHLVYSSQSKSFSFTHQSVWDVLFSEMCHSDFEKAVSVCTWKQMVMYVRTDPKCEESEEFVYVVPPCDWPILAKRLFQEITSGDADLACSHPCLQHPDFVQKLVQKLLTDTDICRLLEAQQEKVQCCYKCAKVVSPEGFASFCSVMQHEGDIFITQSPIFYLLWWSCSLIVKHILQSAQFQVLSPSTQSQLLTEALACALYVSDSDLVDWLLDRGAVPSQECVRAACCAKKEDVGLVERALQWNNVLSEEIVAEMARVACQQDRPSTLELILSNLPKSAKTQAELDVILAEVILITHPHELQTVYKDLTKNYQIRELPHLSHILSILKKAGAQFRSHIDPHTAAGHTDPSALSEWLEHDVDLSVRDKDSYTLLHRAAHGGALSNVETLLDVMESTGQLAQLVNVQTEEGDTALHLAAWKGHLAVVEVLVKKGADANITNDNNETALLRLADCDNWRLEGCLLPSEDQGAAPSSSPLADFHGPQYKFIDTSGWYTTDCEGRILEDKNPSSEIQWHFSSLYQNNVSITRVKEILRSLVTNTTSYDLFCCRRFLHKQHDLQTPLQSACRVGHSLLVEALIEKGVDVNVRDSKGRTLVHYAAMQGHNFMNVLEALSLNSAQLDVRDLQGQTVLHLAADYGRPSVVEKLIQNNVDVNAKDKRERTPLHLASYHGRDKIVQCLLDNGASVNVADKDGYQPLHVAAGRDHFISMRYLIDKGASVNTKDRYNRTCLHLASSEAGVSTLESLLTHGACVNASDDSGLTPLHWALKSKRYAAAQFLMHSGADINALDQNGNTVLHSLAAEKDSTDKWNYVDEQFVCRNLGRLFYSVSTRKRSVDLNDRRIPTVGLLLKNLGSMNDLKNKQEDTPVMIAVKARNYYVLWEMLQWMCDLSISNNEGNTALHLAAAQREWYREDAAADECMEIMVAKSVDVFHIKNKDGDVPLLMAARAGNFFAMNEILKHDANPFVRGKRGNTILHELIYTQVRENIELDESAWLMKESLISRCTDLINCPNDDGDTPVLTAARYGQWDLMSLFLQHPVDLHVKGKGGSTILHELVFTWNGMNTDKVESLLQLVESIVNKSADLVNCPNDEGDIPVLTAAREGQSFLLSLFLKHPVDLSVKGKRGNTIFHELVFGWDKKTFETDISPWKIVETVVSRCNGLVDCPNDDGDTPVLTAAKESNWSLLTEYQKQKCDVGVCDKRGNTLLHCLAETMQRHWFDPPLPFHIVDGLADLVDRTNEDGNTPLMVAIRAVNMSMVDILLERKCNVRLMNKKGETPLFSAVQMKYWSLVELLLKQDMDVCIVTEEGNTLLHALCMNPNIPYWSNGRERQIIKIIVDRCSPLANRANSRGETPLYLAFLCGNLCVADLLLEQAGSSVDCREGGQTDKPQEAAGLSLAQEGVRTPLHGLAASWGLESSWQYKATHRERVSLWVKRFSHWINHPDPEGYTPIMLALREGNLYLVEQLMRCGAYLSVTDGEGDTVLHALAYMAVRYTQEPVMIENTIIKVTKETQANVDVVVKVTELAKAAGVTPLTANKEGVTALDILRQNDTRTRTNWERILLTLWLSKVEIAGCIYTVKPSRLPEYTVIPPRIIPKSFEGFGYNTFVIRPTPERGFSPYSLLFKMEYRKKLL